MSGLKTISPLRSRESLMQKCSRKIRQPDAKRCCDRLYSTSDTHSWHIYFTIMWDLKLHIAVSAQVKIETALGEGSLASKTLSTAPIALSIGTRSRNSVGAVEQKGSILYTPLMEISIFSPLHWCSNFSFSR